jgi:hypothetical protein
MSHSSPQAQHEPLISPSTTTWATRLPKHNTSHQDIVAKPRLVTVWNYPWFIGDDERSRSCCCSYGELRGLVYIFVGEMLWLIQNFFSYMYIMARTR